jgi:hypothetical protein
MASFLPCKKNDAGGYTFYVSLRSQANVKIMKASPTLAAGDVKISIDDGAPANLGTLPVVDADFTKRVKVVLAQAEINGDNLTVIFSDAAGDEWCDLTVNIQTAANQFDGLAVPGSAMTLASDSITAAVFDESTAFPVKSADTGSTAIARVGADSDTLETLSDQLDTVDTVVDAIKLKTDNLPASPAAVGSAMTLAAGAVDATAIADNAIDAGAIATGAITDSKFAAGAITSTVLAANAIGATQIASNAIAATKIASAAITAAKFGSSAITSTVMAADAIGASQFAQAAADKVWSTAARSLTTYGTLVADTVTAVWAALTSALTGAGSIGKKLADWVLGTDNKALLSSDAQTGVTIPAVTTVGTVTNAVTVGTNSDKAGYGLADDAITAAKFDESTAFPLKSADTGATAVARTGADSDTLETLSDQIDATATSGALSTVDGKIDAVGVLATGIDAVADKLDTAMEADGGVHRFTTNALEQAPSGSGATAQEVWEYPVDGALTAEEALVNINTKIDTLSPTAGTYAVTIVTQQSDLTRISGVLVAILNATGTTIRTVTTDSNGDAAITLDAGDFTAVSFKAMVNISDVAFTISGAAAVTISGTVVSPSVPAAGLQTIYYIPTDPALVLDDFAKLFAEAVLPNQAVDTATLTGDRVYATKVGGHYEIQLAKGGEFIITGMREHDVFVTETITVTSDDTKSLNSYLA